MNSPLFFLAVLLLVCGVVYSAAEKPKKEPVEEKKAEAKQKVAVSSDGTGLLWAIVIFICFVYFITGLMSGQLRLV